MSSDGKSQSIAYNVMEDVEDVSKYRPGGFHPAYIGDTLKDGRYRIVHKLGYGGYSTIWLALDTLRRQYVAVKICSADAGVDSAETQTLQQLSDTKQEGLAAHPGEGLVQSLVDAFDLRGPNGLHECLVMPPAMMSVRDAKEASYSRLFRPDVARSIIAQLALAVDFVHGKGIVHGGQFSSRDSDMAAIVLRFVHRYPHGKRLFPSPARYQQSHARGNLPDLWRA
jgi:hypothetical protein